MEERVEDLVSLEVPCDPDAPSVVRHALAQKESLGWVLGDIMLVASELVTNAVRHSGCLPEHHLQIRASLRPQRLRISVSDPGLSGASAKVRELSDFSDGGVGLLIVDQLAHRWGAERADGYQVWAELDLPDV
jgi:anti-sigma regulatory factor (Ser/Thr protein kinase)